MISSCVLRFSCLNRSRSRADDELGAEGGSCGVLVFESFVAAAFLDLCLGRVPISAERHRRHEFGEIHVVNVVRGGHAWI